jgi:hypothetical protein
MAEIVKEIKKLANDPDGGAAKPFTIGDSGIGGDDPIR